MPALIKKRGKRRWRGTVRVSGVIKQKLFDDDSGESRRKAKEWEALSRIAIRASNKRQKVIEEATRHLGFELISVTADECLPLLLRQSRSRARKKGMDFDITLAFLKKAWKAQDGKCLLTGIPFASSPNMIRRPFYPSIDRIDSARGYVRQNVRIVCIAVNAALFSWGAGVFDYVSGMRIETINAERVAEI